MFFQYFSFFFKEKKSYFLNKFYPTKYRKKDKIKNNKHNKNKKYFLYFFIFLKYQKEKTIYIFKVSKNKKIKVFFFKAPKT